MPFVSEHSCRLREPGLYEADSFRRVKRGKLVLVIGRRKGKRKTEAQAYRYPVKLWTVEQARKH